MSFANAFGNLFKIAELRKRLLFTLFCLAVYRVGVFVTASVKWHGGTYSDVLVLEQSAEQPLHLVAKLSTTIGEQRVSGY